MSLRGDGSLYISDVSYLEEADSLKQQIMTRWEATKQSQNQPFYAQNMKLYNVTSPGT